MKYSKVFFVSISQGKGKRLKFAKIEK